MLIRTLSLAAAVALAASILGCGGPSAYREQVREDARDRVNLVNAQLNYDQARQAYETGQFNQAMREIDRAISRSEAQPRYYILRGRIQLEMARLEGAIKSFERAIELDGESAEAWYFSGIVYQRWSKDEQALECYSTAYEKETTNVQYLLATAESMIALNAFSEAHQLVSTKLAYFENNAAMHHLLGQVAQLQGDHAEAVRRLNEARLLRPDDLTILEELARAQYMAGRYADAYESISRLQAEVGTEARTDLLMLEARCLTALDRTIEARSNYLLLSELAPADPVVWAELGAVAWDLGDYRRVARCATQLEAIAPERFEGYFFRGVNDRNRGDLPAAAAAFSLAVDRAPQRALPHLMLGRTYEQMGRPQAALRCYAMASQAEPDNVLARALNRRLNQAIATVVE